MKDSEVVERAIEILDQRGWCQCQASDDEGRVCMSWAVGRAAITERFDDTRQRGRVLDHISAITGGLSVPYWNDQAGRTFDEVRDKLTETAKDLRDRGQ